MKDTTRLFSEFFWALRYEQWCSWEAKVKGGFHWFYFSPARLIKRTDASTHLARLYQNSTGMFQTISWPSHSRNELYLRDCSMIGTENTYGECISLCHTRRFNSKLSILDRSNSNWETFVIVKCIKLGKENYVRFMAPLLLYSFGHVYTRQQLCPMLQPELWPLRILIPSDA